MGQANRKVGQYTILNELGHGSFADVYRAKDNKGKEVAMKVIRRNYTLYDQSSGSTSLIATDIDFLSKVDHKFILKFIEGFRDEETEQWCLVTELCKEDLKKVIERQIESKQTFDEDTILNWFGMIASALDHLHDLKIMHRDMKPENILVSNDGILKLSDFGVAKFLAQDPTKGSRCGSVAYMAPEVFFEKPYDMKCDVWSLGVILFELCTLETKVYEKSREIPPRYSRELQETVKLMLQDKPAERPNIKTVCHIHEIHRKMNAGGSKGGSYSIAPSAKEGNNKTNNTDPGYQSSSASSCKDHSFLSGLDEDSISMIVSDLEVTDVVHSQTSNAMYARLDQKVSGYKWDRQKKTFTHLFNCIPEEGYIQSLVLAPQHPADGTDQLYISVGYFSLTKKVFRLGGRKMEDKVLLPDTSYIDDECDLWTLGSDPHKQVLLIHPWLTSVIYIHVEEKRHAKVDLNEITEWDSKIRIWKIELIGRNLLLGELRKYKLYMFDLVVTTEGASINRDTKWRPVKTCCGRFVALCPPMTNDEQKHKQLHLITAEYKKNDDYTVLREYRVGLFGVGDATHGSSSQLDCSSQSAQSLRVRGEGLRPLCIIQDYTSCPVFIGQTIKKMFAIEL